MIISQIHNPDQELCDASMADAMDAGMFHGKEKKGPNMVRVCWDRTMQDKRLLLDESRRGE